MNSGSEPERKAQKLRDRLKEATADAILAAAERVFAEQGPHAARMEDIGAAAGVSVGTLYNYFADRGALFSALLELRRAELISRIDDAVESVRGESFERELESMLRTLFEHFDAHRAFLSIVFAGEHVPESAKSTVNSRDTMRAIYARFEAIVGRGLEAGTLSLESAQLYPALLMGMARGVMMRSLHETSLDVTAARAREIVNLFLDGSRRSS
jgi:AcrR family transcriptional regulator